MMIDDNAPTHERRKLVKTYKNVCSFENGLRLLNYTGRPTLEMSQSILISRFIDLDAILS